MVRRPFTQPAELLALAAGIRNDHCGDKAGGSLLPDQSVWRERSAATVALEQLFEGQAEAVVAKVVEKALEGDRMAMRLVFERLMGSRHERPLTDLNLPPIQSAADGAAVAAAILAAAGSRQGRGWP